MRGWLVETRDSLQWVESKPVISFESAKLEFDSVVRASAVPQLAQHSSTVNFARIHVGGDVLACRRGRKS